MPKNERQIVRKFADSYNLSETNPERVILSFGTVTATTIKRFRVPKKKKILNVYAETSATQATHASNLIAIGVVNKGTAGAGSDVIVDVTSAANSNNSTGGSAFTAYTKRAMTVITTSDVNKPAADSVIEVTVNISGTISKDINIYIDMVDSL